MWDAVLVCDVVDPRDDGCRHFRLYLTKETAQFLLTLKAGLEAAEAAMGTAAYCVELFYAAGDWGTVAGFEPPEGGWAVAKPTVRLRKPESVELETVKATDSGVIFQAAWKNDDSNAYFETQELPWAAVEAYAAADDEFPENVLPGAGIDYAENAAGGGTWMDENGDEHDGDEPDEEDEDG